MKSSLSPTTPSAGARLMIFLVLFLFLFFFSSANCRLPTHTLPSSSTSTGNTHSHNHNHNHHSYCDSFSRRNSRSLCTELQRIHHRLPKPVPPSQENGIDPRYGVEKRLVPSGPNPLHN